MTSHHIEGHHLTLINEILSLTGIECIESPRESTGSEEELGDYENYEGLEAVAAYEHIELSLGEEAAAEEQNDDISDEKGCVFPSASLRKILPDQIREFEKINRIHVLPEEFSSTIDPALIPKVASTAPQRCIDILAELVGCTKYKSSLAEFWFLDTLANLLRRGQADSFDRATQAVLLIWFCEFMKEIQHFDAADRERLLRRFESNMLAAAEYIATEGGLPTPADIGVDYKPPVDDDLKTVELTHAVKSNQSELKTHIVTFKNTSYECNLRNLTRIIHYIYDLFSTDYQYELVRSIFTNTPEYALVDTPHELRIPKSLYSVVKPKAKGKGKEPKKDKGKKDKKKIPDPPEYIELMNLKKREEEELQQKETIEKEEWELKTHILPLSMAVDDEFFNSYWPSAVPATIREENEGKAKGRKNK